MSAPVMRASDQDREEAVQALSDEYAAGRLDHAEFESRMARAQQVTYLHELDPLFADLPPRRRAPVPVDVPVAGRRHGHRFPFGLLVPAAVVTAFVLLGWHALWLLVPVWWLAAAAGRRRAWERRAAWRHAVASGASWDERRWPGGWDPSEGWVHRGWHGRR